MLFTSLRCSHRCTAPIRTTSFSGLQSRSHLLSMSKCSRGRLGEADLPSSDTALRHPFTSSKLMHEMPLPLAYQALMPVSVIFHPLYGLATKLLCRFQSSSALLQASRQTQCYLIFPLQVRATQVGKVLIPSVAGHEKVLIPLTPNIAPPIQPSFVGAVRMMNKMRRPAVAVAIPASR